MGADHQGSPGSRSAVTIGAYDGVHIGHRAVLDELRRIATDRGLQSVVVTFDRHPAAVVRPESAPRLLTDLEQKLELLSTCGIDRTLVLPFDRERANEAAEEFIEEVLVGTLGAKLVVVGTDFHFGHGRKGNVALLKEQGRVFDFEVQGFALETVGGSQVSSTRIRNLLGQGKVEAAALLLGRDHEVRGKVVRGDGRGGTVLGMPTANVDVPPEILVPADGIYAGWFSDDHGTRHPAAISVGRRPTFYGPGGPSLVEAHLIDFVGDLYDHRAQVTFHAVVRSGQLEFRRIEDLVGQMQEDVRAVRGLFG